MNTIPTQPLGKDVCANCGEPIHLANHSLGPIWKHSNDVEWCPLKARPSSRPWPEEVPR